MNNLLKILWFSFLGVLLFGMFFTLINNDKNIDILSSSTLSGDTLSISWTELSSSWLVLVDTWNIGIETILVEKKILDTSSLKNQDSVVDYMKEKKIKKNTIWEPDEKVSDTKVELVSDEDKTIIDNIKKELTWDYIPNKVDLPWINLKTNVWNEYIVWVRSLKINDKTFRKKSWYLYYGDILKQLTTANSRGCFKMEVLNSKNISNKWKVWYVCKKYLSQYIEEESNNNTNIYTASTKVWNVYSVITKNIDNKKTDKKLSVIKVWTVIEQVTTEDNNWCFNALVLISYWDNKDVWKVWYVCKKNLEKVSFYCINKI